MDWNYNETNISLEYSGDNLKKLLERVCKKENDFSQYDFIKWCDNLAMAFHDDEREGWNGEETIIAGVARNIECQWDLFLINTYSSKELHTLDFSKVVLPHHWFIEWHRELG